MQATDTAPHRALFEKAPCIPTVNLRRIGQLLASKPDVDQAQVPQIAVDLAYGVDIRDWPGHWIIARCNPQGWRITARKIEANGARVFAPFATERRWQGGQWRNVERALFREYLPVNLTDYNFDAFKHVADVKNLVDVSDQRRFAKELRPFQIAMIEGIKLELYSELIVGKRARVLPPHPLQGTEGTIESRCGHDRFVIRCSQMLSGSAAVELDGAALEIIE